MFNEERVPHGRRLCYLSNKQMDFELIKRIANQMRDPLAVKKVHVSNWSSLSLAGGYPALLLLFAELDHVFSHEDWGNVAHKFIFQIIKTIESEGIGNISLFGGLAGVCFCLQYASKEGRRYKRVIDKLDAKLAELVPLFHLAPIEQTLDTGEPINPALYEVIQGVSGIGIYLLKKPIFNSLLYKCISLLIRLTESILVSGYQVPRWYVAPRYFSHDQLRQHYPNGNFDLGLSHGIPGVLSFLAIALKREVEVKGQREAIGRISKWVISKRKSIDKRYFWDSMLSLEEEIHPFVNPHQKSRDAWCYGTPGVARALYLAGDALENNAMKREAEATFHSVFTTPALERDLPGPTLCHGVGGLLLLTQLMYRETGSHLLQKEVANLRGQVLAHFDSNAPFGFKRAIPNKSGGYAWVDQSDLLEGAAGVLLSLLALYTGRYQWADPFLIN